MSGNGSHRIAALTGTVLVWGLLVGIAPEAEAAKAGSLDRSFGHNGRVLTDFFGRNDRAYAAAIQEDGRIVVAGEAFKPGFFPHPVLARYRRDGRLDRSFGNRGRAVIRCDSSTDYTTALAIQSNGRILTAATCSSHAAVARLRRDGTLDRSFANNGIVETALPTGVNHVTDMAIQPDGKIVVVGYTQNTSTGDEYLFLVRYLRDGNLDPSFGDGGTLITRFGTDTYVRGDGVAVQPDGRLVVSGTVGSNWIVARFLPHGSLDPSFDGDGIKYSAPTLIGEARDVQLEPDGRIVTAGSRFALGRYLPDGSFDSSFADGGSQRVRFSGGRSAEAESVALQGDGKIVVAGTTRSLTGLQDLHFALARLRLNGRLDRSFGRDGTVSTGFRLRLRRQPHTAVNDRGEAVAIQPNGRIVVAGYSEASRRSDDFAIARYLGAPRR